MFNFKSGVCLSLFILCTLVLTSTFASEAAWDGNAQRITAFVDSQASFAEKLLEKLVNMNSQTEHMAGVRAVGDVLAKELQHLGFTTYWEKMPKQMHRAGNLFAVHQGTRGKRLLLIGHLDTVFASSTRQPFHKLTPSLAKGIGVADMKGGDVVIVQALKALASQGLLADATIYVALMGDEENAGKPTALSRHGLRQLAAKADIALDFESGPVSVGRRGISKWQLTTTGVQQHSSLIFQPDIGMGASYELARILYGFGQAFQHTENVTVNPALLLAGTDIHYRAQKNTGLSFGKKNVIAKQGLAVGDLRYLDRAQMQAIEQQMQSIVAAHWPKTTAHIAFKELIPPTPVTKANQALLIQLSNINKQLSSTPLRTIAPAERGGGDISFIADLVSACLIGLGPEGSNEHSEQESVDLTTLHQATKRAALLMRALVQ